MGKDKIMIYMYLVENSLCAWHAGWMASALALLGDKTEPAKLLKEASNCSGCFSELFEINRPKVKMHLWFSTASGNYVYALNQILLHCSENEIVLAPAVPESWNTFSYKLPCYGNMVAEVKIENNQITKLVITPGDPNTENKRVIAIPEKFVNKSILSNRKPLRRTTDFYTLKLW